MGSVDERTARERCERAVRESAVRERALEKRLVRTATSDSTALSAASARNCEKICCESREGQVRSRGPAGSRAAVRGTCRGSHATHLLRDETTRSRMHHVPLTCRPRDV